MKKQDGTLVPDGTDVTFSTDAGSFDPTTAKSAGGSAGSQLRSPELEVDTDGKVTVTSDGAEAQIGSTPTARGRSARQRCSSMSSMRVTRTSTCGQCSSATPQLSDFVPGVWRAVFCAEDGRGGSERDGRNNRALALNQSRPTHPPARNWKGAAWYWSTLAIALDQHTPHTGVLGPTFYDAQVWDAPPSAPDLLLAFRQAALITLANHTNSGPGMIYIAPGGNPVAADALYAKKPAGLNSARDVELEGLKGRCKQLYFVLYVGCHTAVGTRAAGNLMTATKQAGAMGVGGFKGAPCLGWTTPGGTYVEPDRMWLDNFYGCTCNGRWPVKKAAAWAAASIKRTFGRHWRTDPYYGYNTSWFSWGRQRLVPARYGQ